MENLAPEEYLAREVYAHFGVAYYLSECVHRGLVNSYAVLPFTPKTAARPRIQERRTLAEGQTLGELVTATKRLLPSEHHALMDWALKQRNFLAHGFWYERSQKMSTEEGQNELIAELQTMERRFSELNDAIENHVLQHLGISEEQLVQTLDESNSVDVEPAPQRRIPRTDETIEMSVHGTREG